MPPFSLFSAKRDVMSRFRRPEGDSLIRGTCAFLKNEIANVASVGHSISGWFKRWEAHPLDLKT
jgi:hypothetical protein